MISTCYPCRGMYQKGWKGAFRYATHFVSYLEGCPSTDVKTAGIEYCLQFHMLSGNCINKLLSRLITEYMRMMRVKESERVRLRFDGGDTQEFCKQ